MNIKRILILIISGLIGLSSIINLLKTLLFGNNTSNPVDDYDVGRIIGRIIGGVIISFICIFIFTKVILKIKEEKFYKS